MRYIANRSSGKQGYAIAAALAALGARVTLVDEDTEERKTFQLVGEQEADLERGLLNVRSPLARALIGKDEGDTVEVVTPGGEKSYEIIAIKYA